MKRGFRSLLIANIHCLLQNDIKSLEEWKHVSISENTVDNDILAIDDTILTQALLTFRQRQEDIVSFVMRKSNQ
jgi:hypothetical protein